MDAFVNFFQNLVDRPQVIVGAIAGSLALLYSGVFRGIGAFISRFTTPILMGWWFYSRSDNPNKLNVTLNIISDVHLDIDTVVADKLLTDVYKNHFIAQLLKLAAKRTTAENPLITLRYKPRHKRWFRFSNKTEAQLYEAIYNPLISEVSEKTNNIFSFMGAIGVPMRSFRFVLALTYERGIPGRDQHFRCMMIAEDSLLALPAVCPPVDHPQYTTRHRTLQCIADSYQRHPERFGVVKFWLPEAWMPELTTTSLSGGAKRGA
ncbi:MAG: hypothetical protein BGP06_13545 [Rhizobiales bacterium 65-9]|nr:hypothetical protein [Hyphomicrobiales bacterium]OJY36722.1 MAG: hypothetical protein BGP06_13545 [Rhizobiales bacterium 65-9]